MNDFQQQMVLKIRMIRKRKEVTRKEDERVRGGDSPIGERQGGRRS